MENKKVRVERANVVLYVEDYEVQHYLNLGYNVTDNYGNIIQAALPVNLGALQKAFVEHTQIIKDLEAEIERLKTELEKAKKPEPAKKKSAKTTKAE